MHLDLTICRKTFCNLAGKLRDWLKYVDPAKITREDVACPLSLVSSNAENDRIAIQWVIKAECLVAVRGKPFRMCQFFGGQQWWRRNIHGIGYHLQPGPRPPQEMCSKLWQFTHPWWTEPSASTEGGIQRAVSWYSELLR